MEVVMFSKMLQRAGGLSVAQVADVVADLGIDGVDLTVRPGGHVDPANVAAELPAAVETLRAKGLRVPMITTAVTSATDEHAEEIFAVASREGIDHLKLGYWRYDGFGRLAEQRDEMRTDLAGLRELGAAYDVTPAVHTHSGDFLSANPAVLEELLRGGAPESLGAYVDPGHLAVEGGKSGWKMGLDLLAEYVQMASIKDFGWFRAGDREEAWESRKVPLSEGIVPWKEVFTYLDEIGFDGPVSVHSEYDGLPLDELLDQTRDDLAYLKATAAAI